MPIPTIDVLNAVIHVNTVAEQGVAPCVCPGELLHEHMGYKDQPFFTVTRGLLFVDYGSAMGTLDKIKELDAAENVFVVMAHDLSIRGKIAFFPMTINDWMSSGVKGETRWLFCGPLELECCRMKESSFLRKNARARD
ncbi:hypothetical protein ANO14919_099350 [Xylariales sp. No.14919]|nr:hypothetical protein ANO14919_099350 [Xylariales sp. No.14919]